MTFDLFGFADLSRHIHVFPFWDIGVIKRLRPNRKRNELWPVGWFPEQTDFYHCKRSTCSETCVMIRRQNKEKPKRMQGFSKGVLWFQSAPIKDTAFFSHWQLHLSCPGTQVIPCSENALQPSKITQPFFCAQTLTQISQEWDRQDVLQGTF